MLEVVPNHKPLLEPGFIPARLWNESYRTEARRTPRCRDVQIRIERPDGTGWVYRTPLLPDEPGHQAANLRYLERLVKCLLWAWGGNTVLIAGAEEMAARLATVYAVDGERSFDHTFMGKTCFRADFRIETVKQVEENVGTGSRSTLNRDLSGCRIGFDLGGSDRKAAALVDGEVVFSEEVKWDPYFQRDPDYHFDGIRDSLERAARALPRVDAIGGSAAGIYVDNEPRVGSLFRGVPKEDFDNKIRHIFRVLQKEWNDVPFIVANDGDVTALAGAQALGDNEVLGISMGTSEAAGYIDRHGSITGWLNELAFVPVDYRPGAPRDEWSGDIGCGVQYFSQQALRRLVPASGLQISNDLSLPEQLEAVQEKMGQGDTRAAAIYQTIGCAFGYSIAHYADFYDFKHLLFLGRVSSGEGGQLILQEAEKVLSDQFPELARKLKLTMPDEKMKRHGQAVAAASLPVL